MTDLLDVMDGLAAQIKSECGLNEFTVGGTAVFPAFLVPPPAIPDYRDDLGVGGYTARFRIPVFVSQSYGANHRQLVGFIDPRSSTSVFAAVESDRTLGGLDVDALVAGAPEDMTPAEVAGYGAWGQFVAVTVRIS